MFVTVPRMYYRYLQVLGTEFRIFFHILSVSQPETHSYTKESYFHLMYERVVAYLVTILCIISYAITEAASEFSVCGTKRGRYVFGSHLCQ